MLCTMPAASSVSSYFRKNRCFFWSVLKCKSEPLEPDLIALTTLITTILQRIKILLTRRLTERLWQR